MSNRAMAWAIDVQGIGGTDRLILMLLAECHNGKTGQCNPGIDWLQERTGLKDRALQTRMKALEKANLVDREYEFLGRGKGSKVSQYNLKIGIMGAVKNEGLDPHQITPALKCARKNMQLDPHLAAGPYKEEPEKNRNNISGKSALEEIWPCWSQTGRKRSKSRANLTQQLNRLSKTHDLEQIVKSCQVYAKTTAGEFHCGLNRFLSSGQWENWIGQDMAGASDPEISDWQQAARLYVDHGTWNNHLGPAPHEPGCVAPQGILTGIARQLGPDHRRTEQVSENAWRAAS